MPICFNVLVICCMFHALTSLLLSLPSTLVPPCHQDHQSKGGHFRHSLCLTPLSLPRSERLHQTLLKCHVVILVPRQERTIPPANFTCLDAYSIIPKCTLFELIKVQRLLVGCSNPEVFPINWHQTVVAGVTFKPILKMNLLITC